ncbi:F-box/WD repeat-containing protein 8 [Synchiropus splendidus]|uniref:F-box/WD repeat-containing protein 8 n=1 Tax=Synchiropus splendidus TaxID=270530 RepID=UPI00237EC11C|nr:F-box/WD repeat-containing protein 8 [Synchiropus splendidus]
MAEDELAAFRENWKRELTTKNEQRLQSPATTNRYFEKDHDKVRDEEPSRSEPECEEDQPEYISIARSLLDGRTSPLRDRIEEDRTRRKREFYSSGDVCASSPQPPQRKMKMKKVELVDQLIQDLNEVNNIPFFDVQLPYELALQIFQHLTCAELGRCAQVSRDWKHLAEDDSLWFPMCLDEGFHKGARMSDSPCWKSTLRDCRASATMLRRNWKTRDGSIVQLNFDLGKVLCDVASCGNLVMSGYSSGHVRLWDTLHWDASFIKVNQLSANTIPRPPVTRVQVSQMLAAAAYEDGCVDVWSTETGGDPIHHYQTPGRLQALSLSPDSPVLVSAVGTEVRVDRADEHGYWRPLCLRQLPKTVESLVALPSRGRQSPLVALSAGESVFLLDPQDEEPRTLHSVYGHPVTCLDTCSSRVAFGVKRTGWAMHDGGNKIHVHSLESAKLELCVGSSAGDFTCINLRDAAPELLACGNRDRRVRVFDLRAGSPVVSLYAHQLGVTAVQTDDWKLVSGGGEGLVCVWDLRMKAKLWESYNRHPVRHVRFSSSSMVTANIPDDKSPRGACITDDDLTAHRRHRGVICYYDFQDQQAPQEHVLPICRSDYTESHGYNYNIGLTVPYDRLPAT